MSHDELLQLLADAGFETGWVLTGEKLTLWEHDQDPPAPLTRPKPSNETPIAD
jgi:hypothetical protein